MLAKQQSPTQLGFYSTFEEQLSHQHPLYILANMINWKIFEEAFSKLYSDEARPAKPIWLMVSLLLLKHIRNISDESVVEQWSENCYYQYLVGEKVFACGVPCQASDLVHFKNRIGTEGIELILKESIRINGKDWEQNEATTDTTLQPALEQQQRLTEIVLKNNFVDRGYRGVKEVLTTKIIIPDAPTPKRTTYEKQKLRKGFKRRAAIEPKIGHLKQDHRLSRNFYARVKGDNNNVMLAAAGMNFKRMMNKWKQNLHLFLVRFFRAFYQMIESHFTQIFIPAFAKTSF